MISSPGPDVAGIEELYFSVPVAGSDRRWELTSRVVFGRADVFRPDDRTLARFGQLAAPSAWEYSYVVFPVDLEPLRRGHYRQVSVTACFTTAGIVAKHDTGTEQHLHGGVPPTRGVGGSRVTWVLRPADGQGHLQPEGHQLGCLLQRPRGTAASEVTIDVSVTSTRGLAKVRDVVATMKEPQVYRLAFDGESGNLVRVPGREEEPDGAAPVAPAAVRTPELPVSLNRKVVVFHGRDRTSRRELFAFLRAIGLDPKEWLDVLKDTGQGAPYIGEALDAAMENAQAFLVFMTPDEVVRLKPEHGRGPDDWELRPQDQARPNVLFEAGLAFGRFPERTLLVEFGQVRPLSDLGGRHVVKLHNSSESRHTLAQRLKAIGCPVDLNGTDWLSAGNLTPPSTDVPPPGAVAANGEPPEDAAYPGECPPGDDRPESVTFDKVVAKPNTLGHIVYGEVLSRGSDISLLTLEGTFYSTDGEILGTAVGGVSSLRAGRPKNFQLLTTEDVAGYAEIRLQVGSRLP
ncbi:TIR domain-containing protein [Streptomyces sp. P11-1]|uniref:TIR domain-containing protein n=1 Tax=Streptomyces TaxID=1883 RepID=UPI0035DFAF99